MTESPPTPGVAKRLMAWAKRHKVKTVLILIAGFIVIELLTIPWFGVARLKSDNPSETALMRQRMREAESEGKTLRITQRWIPLSKIPRHLIDAVVVAEDGMFYAHHGIDWFEVRESIEKNIDQKRAARGASTITQQLAKNLYLSTSKDPIRKGKELIITLLMENQLGKNRILELYLNCIEWGRGIFGVDAAAHAYFGKSASALTLEESIRLASVIPSPLKHRASDDSRYVLRRKDIVLRRMQARRLALTAHKQEDTTHTIQTQVPVIPEIEFPIDSTDTGEDDPNGL
jgi:monofunctional glycosyltransferase